MKVTVQKGFVWWQNTSFLNNLMVFREYLKYLQWKGEKALFLTLARMWLKLLLNRMLDLQQWWTSFPPTVWLSICSIFLHPLRGELVATRGRTAITPMLFTHPWIPELLRLWLNVPRWDSTPSWKVLHLVSVLVSCTERSTGNTLWSSSSGAFQSTHVCKQKQEVSSTSTATTGLPSEAVMSVGWRQHLDERADIQLLGKKSTAKQEGEHIAEMGWTNGDLFHCPQR